MMIEDFMLIIYEFNKMDELKFMINKASIKDYITQKLKRKNHL